MFRMFPSLKHGLLWLWLSIAAVAVTLGWTVWSLSRQGAEAQVETAMLRAAVACTDIVVAHERARRVADVDPPAAMAAAVDLALRDQLGIEGGLWRPDSGVVAYAYPTYEGSGIKRDVPAAELERIESLAERTHLAHRASTDVRAGLRETLVLQACPPSRDAAQAVGWTLTRVPTVAAESLDRLAFALALLLGFVVVTGGWLGWTLTRWTRGLATLEGGLQASDASPVGTTLVRPTGLSDLDRLGAALNDYAARAAAARGEAGRLAVELATAQRLAALGRLSAGLAHEIRNPLGTMRLMAENALAADRAIERDRSRGALQAVLVQTARMESLVASLLALTRPFRVQRAPVDLDDWLSEQAQRHAVAAAERGIHVVVEVAPELRTAAAATPPWMDPVQCSRMLDNLLLNALAHLPPGGCVTLRAGRDASGVRLHVVDDGPGVPEAVVPHLFEPFATGRDDGTGLGLALAREIVQAHGGRITYRPVHPHGADFRIDLPWPAS